MDTSSIINLGKKYLKGTVTLQAGKQVLNKRIGLIRLGIGAVAGAGYLTYSLLTKKKRKKEDINYIDDVAEYNITTPGDNYIVVYLTAALQPLLILQSPGPPPGGFLPLPTYILMFLWN